MLRRMRQQIDAGNMPTDELIDGSLILLGGLLLILPGFISDAFGLVVLFPPTRALIRNVVKRRVRITTIRRYNGRPYDDGPGGPRLRAAGHRRLIGSVGTRHNTSRASRTSGQR